MNPARNGPAWGPEATQITGVLVPSVSDVGYSTPYVPAPAVRSVDLLSILAGVGVALTLVGVMALFVWNRYYRVRPKKVSNDGGEGVAEVSVETGRNEMHEDSAFVLMHEIEAPTRYEMDARVEVEIG